MTIAVEEDLRSRLAAHLSKILEFGARKSFLCAKGMIAREIRNHFRSDLCDFHEDGVEVTMRFVPQDGDVGVVISGYGAVESAEIARAAMTGLSEEGVEVFGN